MDNFNEQTILWGLHTKWTGKTVHFAKETDSTNLWIKRLAAQGAEQGTLAVADIQNAGRGRLGRRWSAPGGTSVMMSILLRPSYTPSYAPMMTLIMGLSVAQACKAAGADVSIKWPNDAVINGKKICGILTEMSAVQDKIEYAVIGTGINVNLREFPPELQKTATSLCLELGHDFDRLEILDAVLIAFEKNYGRFLQTLDLSLIKEDYERLLANKDRQVRVLDPLGEYEGIARGINAQGELLVELNNGEICEIGSGEVSVRGIYGYV